MNEREKRFCQEYLIDLDATNAARRAGYADSTARNAACWISGAKPRKPKLRAEIDRLIAERSRRTGVNADRVLRELARIAFANVTDVLDDDGVNVRRDISRDDSAALAKIHRKQTANGLDCEVRMHDKNRALEMLGKHLGMFADNLRVQQLQPVIIDETDSEDDAGEP